MMDVCHYTCVQIHRMCDTKSELGCKLWTLGDVDVSLYVHRLPLCAPLVGDGDTGKAERMRGQRVCEDSVLSAQFSMNLQLLWKSKSIFKKKKNKTSDDHGSTCNFLNKPCFGASTPCENYYPERKFLSLILLPPLNNSFSSTILLKTFLSLPTPTPTFHHHPSWGLSPQFCPPDFPVPTRANSAVPCVHAALSLSILIVWPIGYELLMC